MVTICDYFKWFVVRKNSC